MELTLIPSRRKLGVEADETILDALLRQDTPISHSCRDGRCGLCRCTFSIPSLVPTVDASVDMTPVLACQTVPNADCLIEIPDPDDILTLPPQVLRGRIEAIEEPVEQVRRLTLSTNRRPQFEAGQYFEVTWASGIVRMYSAASLASDPNLVFEIQLHHYGLASDHVANSLRVGDTVRIRGPLGTAYLRKNCEAPILCISNNTGLGSLIALVRTIAEHKMHNAVHIYAGFMMAEYVYGEQELRRAAKALKNLRRCSVVVGGGALKRTDRLGLLPEVIEKDLPSLADYRVYAFGSPHAIDTTSRALRSRGVIQERLNVEPYYFSKT